jgi:RNA polymerase sigma-70 factor (ECF subfamily)
MGSPVAVKDLAATVGRVQQATLLAPTERESDGRAWLRALRSSGAEREQAVASLHALLVKAARFELIRRRSMLDGASETIEDLAVQSANNALIAVLRKLDSYRFESRFTTWAYKFGILEAAVLARRRAWQEREIPVDPQAWNALGRQAADLTDDLAARDLFRGLTAAIKRELSPHQREVLTALVLAGVPIDVLAERLNTTRGALYKTLHDARRKLRAALEEEKDD